MQNNLVVLFGATGDLATKKILPAIADLQTSTGLRLIATGRKSLSKQDFLYSQSNLLVENLTEYVKIDFEQSSGFDPLWKAISNSPSKLDQLVFCFALAPDAQLVANKYLLQKAELLNQIARTVKIVIEKPFAEDTQSFSQINDQLSSTWGAEYVFYNDHYLHKQSGIGLSMIRSKDKELDSILENPAEIKSIKFQAFETVTLEQRSGLFENRGMLVDWFHSHALQTLATLCCGLEDKAKRANFISSLTPNTNSIILGQYVGYKQLPGVAADSHTETFMAIKLKSNSALWLQVDFEILLGKAMDQKQVCVQIDLAQTKTKYGKSIWLGIEPPGGHILLADKNTKDYLHVLNSVLAGDQNFFVSAQEAQCQWLLTDKIKPALATKPVKEYPVGSSWQNLCGEGWC